MRLSLMGMAGSGKSYWSGKLERHGFRRFCCDDMIAEKLAPELNKSDGASMSVAEWMGLPYEAGYRDRELRYLSLEAEVLREIIEYLESGEGDSQENLVVDTTGSVIYADVQLITRLSRASIMVLLETPSHVQERLLNAYIAHPHPMVWNGMFSQKPGESDLDALARCYSLLFASRARLYERYGAVTIEYDECHGEHFSVNVLLKRVRAPQQG